MRVRLAVPLSSAAVVPAVPAALSLLVVRASVLVRAAVLAQAAAPALRAVPEQAALVGRAALEVLEVLERV
jgi:hypothetical protein